MEFPDLGKNCSHFQCNKLDFLPVKCDGCQQIFCQNHMKYFEHNCPTPKLIDYQVPVCPLCNEPVPSKRDEEPDIAVGAHLDRFCQSDPAVARRKVFQNKCSIKKCKKKEILPITCSDCGKNFCLIHRHPTDHQCSKIKEDKNTKSDLPKVQRKKQVVSPQIDFTTVQGHLTEDEALAYALSLSMETTFENQAPSNNGLRNQLLPRNRPRALSSTNANCRLS